MSDLLERKVLLSDGWCWLPVVPHGEVEGEPGLTWKRCLFDYSHLAQIHSHRAQSESFQLLPRMGWWDRLPADFNMFRGTGVCVNYTGRNLSHAR